jgi:hypothetical protein
MSERNPFSPALLIGLITAGLISFAAFIILLGWSGDGTGRGTGRGSASPTSAIGFKALADLTDRFIPSRAVQDEADLDSSELLVVPLDDNSQRADVERLLRRRSEKPTLLILPKWRVVPHERRRAWVRAEGPWAAGAAEQLMGEAYEVEQMGAAEAAAGVQAIAFMQGVSVRLPRSPQVIKGDDVEMLIGVPGRGALVAQLGYQPHYVVADPDLLNNHGLRSPQAAWAALDMLERLMPGTDGTILFDTSLGGTGPDRNLIRRMFEPPFLAMTLALLIAALLAAMHGAVRFGAARRPERAIPFGKAALVENSAGLVRLARREVRLGGGYADVVRDDAARAGAAPSGLQGAELDAYLDRFTRPGEPSFSALAEDIRSAPDRGALLAAARALFRWKKDIIR